MTLRHPPSLRFLPKLVPIALAFVFLVASHAFARTEGLSPLPERGLYRLDVRKVADLRPLLELGLDVAGRGPGMSLDLVLDASELDRVRALGFEPVRVDGTSAAPFVSLSPALNPNLGDYHTVAEAAAEMSAYASAYPSLAQLDTLGFSIEGRPLLAMHISDQVGSEEGEPEMLVVGCHHARELMSVEIPLYLMRRLLDGYGSDPVLTGLVNGRSIWIVPIVNPDGHVYVEGHSGGHWSGWWRKNRRDNGFGIFGVDVNRNYGYRWGWDNVGSSPTPNSETYRGTAPFSEPEAAAVRDFMNDRAFTISASIHSYGELFLYPWGYATLDTPDHPVFSALGDSIASQNGYLAGNPKSDAIYLTNGEMDDWVYGDTSLKPKVFGFTFEVNTAEQGGFGPSDALIGETCDLNWGPLLTLLRYSDEPRRVLPPPRTAAPSLTGTVSELELHWSVPTPDPANPPVRHDVRRITSLSTGVDNAEAGLGAWTSTLFSSSTARAASGLRSFWSGSGDLRTSVLTSNAAVGTAAGESLVVMAYWELESGLDYWYAEGSGDGGATWTSLRGNFTTTLDPFGNNEGNGITDFSGGTFQRVTFAWGALGGKETLVRFRCVTDVATAGEGLYLDDVGPVAFEGGITDTNTGSAETLFSLTPPAVATWFQVRAVDGESQIGPWSPRASYDPGVSAVESPPAPPVADHLHPNRPNPFNPDTKIRFTLGRGTPGPYEISVHDASGRLVSILDRGWDSGQGSDRTVSWDGLDPRGRAAGSGVYVVRLTSPRGSTSRKITLLR